MAWQLCLSDSVTSGVSFQCLTSGFVSPITGFMSEIAGMCLWHVYMCEEWIFFWGLEHLHKVLSSKQRGSGLARLLKIKKRRRYNSPSVFTLVVRDKSCEWNFYISPWKAAVSLWHGNWKLKAVVLQIDCSFWGGISMFQYINITIFRRNWTSFRLWFIMNVWMF